jgi:uncharacterized protein
VTDTIDLVRRAYEGFANGDLGPLLGIMDEQVEWYEAEHMTYWPGGALVGPQAVVDGVFAPVARDFDGFRVEVHRIVGAGDTVLAEGRYGGTARATGKPLDAQLAHVWDFRDGKVVRFQQYSDTWHYAEVTGVVPALAGA